MVGRGHRFWREHWQDLQMKCGIRKRKTAKMPSVVLPSVTVGLEQTNEGEVKSRVLWRTFWVCGTSNRLKGRYQIGSWNLELREVRTGGKSEEWSVYQEYWKPWDRMRPLCIMGSLSKRRGLGSEPRGTPAFRDWPKEPAKETEKELLVQSVQEQDSIVSSKMRKAALSIKGDIQMC